MTQCFVVRIWRRLSVTVTADKHSAAYNHVKWTKASRQMMLDARSLRHYLDHSHSPSLLLLLLLHPL